MLHTSAGSAGPLSEYPHNLPWKSHWDGENCKLVTMLSQVEMLPEVNPELLQKWGIQEFHRGRSTHPTPTLLGQALAMARMCLCSEHFPAECSDQDFNRDPDSQKIPGLTWPLLVPFPIPQSRTTLGTAVTSSGVLAPWACSWQKFWWKASCHWWLNLRLQYWPQFPNGVAGWWVLASLEPGNPQDSFLFFSGHPGYTVLSP